MLRIPNSIWRIRDRTAGKEKGIYDEERKGFQNFVDAGFVDTFRLFKQGNGYYTWWSNFGQCSIAHIGWRIDYVMVSSALRNAVKGG
jgi:exodeoxyribonuclease-3